MHPEWPAEASSPFAGFWMGGFEGADHVNARGDTLDLARASGHLDHLEADHARAAALGLRAVRESIGWRICQPHAAAHIELARARRIARSAQAHGLQVLWTLMHYGIPEGLSLHDDRLVDAFARFAGCVAEALGPLTPRPPVYTPINEIGFLSWAAGRAGMLHGAVDAAAAGGIDVGYAVKRRLVRTALAGMQRIVEIDARARFLHVEPVVHVVPDPRDVEGTRARAAEESGWQWQAWDLIAGRADAALGGAPRWLDIIGANHYHDSQWALGVNHRLDWAGGDARRVTLSALLRQAWERYRRPLLLAETSHVGVGRADWVHAVGAELRRARQEGTPVDGLCWYPLVDRPDWVQPQRWHRSGLWHVDAGTHRRVADAPAHAAWRALQCDVSPGPAVIAPPRPRPRVLVFSHLRWDFVRHRTRHLMEAIAAARDIVFVEEPVHARADEAGACAPAWLHVRERGPCLTVVTPRVPAPAPGEVGGFEAAEHSPWAPVLRQWLLQHPCCTTTLWLTTPLAAPLARGLPHQRCVYDCADALHAFAGASPRLREREAELLQWADQVFAATPALAAACRRAGSAAVQELQNGVDAAHFDPARPAAAEACWEHMEAEQILAAAGLAPHARFIGYAGVIDERMDMALLAAVCDAFPANRVLLVGPVVKIDRAALPLRANLHQVGEVPYRVLPWLMKCWQMAVVPFHVDAITRPALPLKVLEALAAGLAVVAAALPELKAWQRAGVTLAADHQAFIAAVHAALAEPEAAASSRRSRAAQALRGLDWATLAAPAAHQTAGQLRRHSAVSA